MNKIRKYFGSFELTWKKVIIFALLSAVYTALVLIIPVFKGTSVSDIGTYLEWWILFGVFLAVNSRSPLDAALKCFVFFLISQPLIYLLQVPFYHDGFGIFRYYRYWFVVTLLTIPGGAIAYFVKKDNLVGSLVLSVATAFLAYSGVMYADMAFRNFPHHILSAIFCFALAAFFIVVLIRRKNCRIVAACITVCALIVSIIITVSSNSVDPYEFDLEDGEWTYTIEDENIAEITVDGNHVTVKAKNDGGTAVIFTDENGREIGYYVDVAPGFIGVSALD